MEEGKSNFRWVVLALLFFNIFFAILCMQCIPALFTEIEGQIPLTNTQKGWFMGALTLASLFFAPVGGGVSDKIGSRWALGIAVMMVALAGALRAYVESANAFIVCMFFIGAGMAVIGPNMPKALGTWFSQKEIALANGLCISGMGVGGAVAMATSASVMSPALGGWRNTMLVLGMAVFVMGILWMIIYKDPKKEGKIEKEKPNMMKNFKKAFKVKDLWLLSAFYGLNMVGMMALITFLPGALEKRGMERAGELVSLMLIATVVFNILGGIISDRIGKRRPILIISSIIFGVGILTLGALKGVPLIISLVITGAALGAIAPVLMTIPVEHKAIGPGLAATAMGLIFMVGNTGGAFGPVVAGKLMDFSGSHWAGFIFMAVVLIAAAGCAVPMTETGRKRKPGEAPTAHGH